MTQCKGCGDMLGPWNPAKLSPTGKMIPQNPDGTNHNCPARQQTQQVQQQQPQQTQQSTATESTNWLIPKADWDMLLSKMASLSVTQDRLTEVYGDLSDQYRAISSLIKNNQEMADAESRYDQDKEDGI